MYVSIHRAVPRGSWEFNRHNLDVGCLQPSRWITIPERAGEQLGLYKLPHRAEGLSRLSRVEFGTKIIKSFGVLRIRFLIEIMLQFRYRVCFSAIFAP